MGIDRSGKTTLRKGKEGKFPEQQEMFILEVNRLQGVALKAETEYWRKPCGELSYGRDLGGIWPKGTLKHSGSCVGQVLSPF